MTNEEARQWFLKVYSEIKGKGYVDENEEAYELAIKALEQEPCDDVISRQAVIGEFKDMYKATERWKQDATEDDIKARADAVMATLIEQKLRVEALPPVRPQEQTGHCKECKYFEYDSVAKVDGVPLIVAHEICSKWGDGCKTKEDGYCFLFEPQESEERSDNNG